MYLRLPDWLANYPTPVVPPFFVTLPKSGTVFLRQSMRRSLGLRQISVSAGPFPQHFLNPTELSRGRYKGRVASAHLTPHACNLAMLNEYFGRWVVHLRDPRAATLSWVHHLCKYRQLEDAKQAAVKFGLVTPGPAAVESWNFDQLLAWHIDNYIPVQCEWCTDWLDIIDSGMFNVMLTTHEEMVSDRAAFWEKVADFYCVPTEKLISGDVGINNRHFRSGRIDEWKEVFSPEQLELSSQLVPEQLKQRFGWSM